ncbi:MAG TPA: DUF1330 domain-containing protein [Caulobacteraceae bacterium]|nr:DUF1330 domain-containing protein [Caulobacteraceae bacterium]
MAGYLIAAIDIKDPEGFDDYRRQVSPIIARYGGRYIVRGGAVTPLEGTAPQRRLVVIEFPSVDAARQFYACEDYAPVLKLRLASAETDVFLVEGYEGG